MGQSVTLLNDPAVEPRMPKVAGLSVDYPTVAGDLEPGMLDLPGTIDRLDEKGKRFKRGFLAPTRRGFSSRSLPLRTRLPPRRFPRPAPGVGAR